MAQALTEPNTNIITGPCHDLTSVIAPFLDLHMLFPLMDFIGGLGIYKKEDITKALIDLVAPTHMQEYRLELCKELGEVAPETNTDIEEKKQTSSTTLAKLEEKIGSLLELIQNQEQVEQLIADGNFNPEYLKQTYEIGSDNIEAFYKYGKFLFDSGSYQDTILIMFYYHALINDAERSFTCFWGKVAAEILCLSDVESIQNCLKDIELLQKMIDEKDEKHNVGGAHHLEILQLRSWLLHWSLFVFFKQPVVSDDASESKENEEAVTASSLSGVLLNTMIEFFLQQKYLNAIQTNCPWLLRYLTAAVVITKGNKKTLKNLVRAIRQENYTYKDPVTEFIDCLLVKFDFEGAQEKLNECEKVFAADYFLHPYSEEFMNSARLFVFETYCRIHTKIDIKYLSEKLNMGNEDAEKWVVNLIRDAKLDAKIDSENGHVIMGQRSASTYQQTIDKTRDLAYRSYQLVSNVLNASGEGKPPRK